MSIVTGSSSADGQGTGKRKAPSSSDAQFEKELRAMMYGFGDVPRPQPESVQLLEDMLMDYLQLFLQQANAACEERNRGSSSAPKIRERDLLFVLRKDPRRHARVQELLEAYEIVKNTRGRKNEDWEKD